MITASFWRDRSVFVTGHTSAQGAWLALALERLGAHVTGYGPDAADGAAIYDASDAGRSLCDVRADLDDTTLLDGALRASEADIVVHLAERNAVNDGAILEAVNSAPFVQAALLVAPERRAAGRKRARSETTGARLLSVYCPQPVGADAAASNLHVLDCVYGFLLLAETACRREGRIAGEWAFAEEGDALALGWSPLLDAAEAQRWNDEWLRAAQSGADMAAFSRIQVEAYLAQRVRAASPLDPAHVEPMKAVA
ncbi:MAG: hypothetical protein U1E28_01570 [Beijerinckiaceae bacterium]